MPSGARCSPQKGHVFSPVENWLEEWPYDAFWRLFLRVNGGEQSVVQVCCIFGVLHSALYSERFPRNWGAKQWGYSGSALGLSAVRLELFKFYKVVFLFKDATKIVGELPIFGQGMTVLKLLTHLFKMCFWGSEEYYQRISVVFYYFFFMNKNRMEEFCGTDQNKKHQFHDCGFSTVPFPLLGVRSFCCSMSSSEEIRLFGFVGRRCGNAQIF